MVQSCSPPKAEMGFLTTDFYSCYGSTGISYIL